MGDQKDVLEGMTKFSGNDGAVVWPMWKDDLMNRVKFELDGHYGSVRYALRSRHLYGDVGKWNRCNTVTKRASHSRLGTSL